MSIKSVKSKAFICQSAGDLGAEMKFFVGALLLFCLPSQSFGVNLEDFVVDIIEVHYATNYPTVCIISVEKNESRESKDVKNILTQKISGSLNISLRVESFDDLRAVKTRPRFCVVLIIESLKLFEKIFVKITAKAFNYQGYYAIILLNGEIDDANEIFRLLWTKRISNVVILYLDMSAVKVTTFFPFNSKSCSDTTPVDVSHFVVAHLFADRTKDLKNCPIRVAAPEIPPFVMTNDKNEVVGRDIDLIKALSEALNFKLDLSYLNYSLAYGFLFDNGTGTGAFKDLLESRADIIISDYFLQVGRLTWLDSSKAYFNTKIVFVVSPGRKLKSIEKLLQPFSKSFWLLLVAYGVLISSAIFLINLKFKSFARSLFNFGSPYLSLLSLVLAVSLTRQPRKSFARLVWVSFVMFCLVLQSVYQGSLFKFLQTDSKLKEVQTIDEMIERDFKFYTIGSTQEFFVDHPRIFSRLL